MDINGQDLIRACSAIGAGLAVIAGIGPGAEAQMTLALVDACEQADVLIGAGRMTKAVEKYQKPMLAEYSPEKIYEYLKAHPEYEKIVLLQSGDVGFYSGAKKLQAVLAEDADFSVRVEPGISSLVYFCAKIGVSWEDAAFVSLHGQHCIQAGTGSKANAVPSGRAERWKAVADCISRIHGSAAGR